MSEAQAIVDAAQAAPVEQVDPSKPVDAAAAAPAEKKDDFLAPKFAALAKKEKEIIQRQRATKELEAKIREREEKLAQSEKGRPANPIEALQRAGYSYDDAVNFILNGQKLTPDQEVKSVRDEIQAFKADQEKKEKLREAAELAKQQSQYEETIENFKQEINGFVDQNASEYELIKINEASHLIYDTIEEHFTRTKKVLSTKEAADMVEAYLEDQVKKVAATNKFKSKIMPQAAPKQEEQSKEPSKTLSNSMTSSAASLLPAKTEQDRMQRALAALSK
jgi:hypothetical protein